MKLEERRINQEVTSVVPAEKKTEEKESLVPPQYIGMPSKLVEELWETPIYIDGEKNKAECERKKRAIEAIRETEEKREAEKEKQIIERYTVLTDDQKNEFSNAQEVVGQVLIKYIQGKRNIESLSLEERFVLDRVRADYEEFKKKNPDKQFIVNLKGIDLRVYNNLAQKLAFEVLENKRNVDEQEKADRIRRKLGIPQHEVKRDDLMLLKEARNRKLEEVKEEDYTNFKLAKGDTDVGVYWYEYRNIAAEKLKEVGKFGWGKERIYFDVPLDKMEELRNLAFEVARDEKIPIAFKHLDVQKTNQIDLRKDSKTTRFVCNFSSVEDAKRFYQALRQKKKYRQMRSDRSLDYHGFNIDGIAHYASGYRERREALKRIVETARRKQNGRYTYFSAAGREITITDKQYNDFVKQYNSIPEPKEAWENADI